MSALSNQQVRHMYVVTGAATAAAPSNSFFPAEKRMDKRGFFRTAASCGLCASVPCDTVSFFPCGEKTGGKPGKTL